MRKPQNLYNAICIGGHLTDAEINRMIEFFNGVVNATSGVVEYDVVRRDALTRLSSLKDIKHWRDRDGQ